MNILVLTSEYPGDFKDPNNNITPVVHYFTREWVKQGHSVIVIHNAHRFPYIVHALPKRIKDNFTSKHGFSIMGTDYIKRTHYVLDGVPVWRIPIVKYIPHGDHPHLVIARQTARIKKILKENEFVPELVLGHWTSPQMQIIKELKRDFQCRTALTMHDLTYLSGKRFNYKKYIDAIDKLGFRNKADRINAQKIIQDDIPTYICYSGIPNEIINRAQTGNEKFNDQSIRAIFVGRLIERKHIDTIIRAFYASSIKKYQIDIVGSGPLEESLKKLTIDLGIESKVVFHGRMNRNDIIDLYKASHLFIMVSSGEAFGLVYLEAMAANCIAIGSFNEGIDGIIKNGENGILCHSGNEQELIEALNCIYEMDTKKKETISENGRKTAEQMSDEIVSIKYLEDISG